MDAHVPTTGETDRQDLPTLFSEQLLAIVDHLLHFLHTLLHLRDCTRAVDEFSNFRMDELVGGDQGDERDCFASPSGHFQESVTSGIDGLLEVEHVLVLFPIHVVVGEKDLQAIDVELHGEHGEELDYMRKAARC